MGWVTDPMGSSDFSFKWIFYFIVVNNMSNQILRLDKAT